LPRPFVNRAGRLLASYVLNLKQKDFNISGSLQ
jgi:hypothetical protein